MSVLSLTELFASFKELNLGRNKQIDDEGISALSKAPFARQLESLNLAETGVTADGVRILSQPKLFMSLKELDLSLNSDIKDVGIAYLSNAPFAGLIRVTQVKIYRYNDRGRSRFIVAWTLYVSQKACIS